MRHRFLRFSRCPGGCNRRGVAGHDCRCWRRPGTGEGERTEKAAKVYTPPRTPDGQPGPPGLLDQLDVHTSGTAQRR